MKFSRVLLPELKGALSESCPTTEHPHVYQTAVSIADSLNFDLEPSESDITSIYYVSGYVCRSLVNCTRCSFCKDLVISGDCENDINNNEASAFPDASVYMDAVNRGGLVKPTDYSFSLCVNMWKVFEEIRKRKELSKLFLKAQSQRILFLNVMESDLVCEKLGVEELFCFSKHDLRKLLTVRFFNCIAKNYVRELSAECEATKGAKRKVDKLSGFSRAAN